MSRHSEEKKNKKGLKTFGIIVLVLLIILAIIVGGTFAFVHSKLSKMQQVDLNEDDLNVVMEECRAGKRGCVACKKQLAKNISETLKPIREKRKYYEEHPEEVDKILIEGTEKARKTAKQTMKKIKQAMKLDYFE